MKLLVLGGVLACLLGSGYGEHFKDVKKKLTRQCGRGAKFQKMHKRIAPRILQAINAKNNDVASGAFIDLKLEVQRVCRPQNKKRVLKMIENSIKYHKLDDDVIGGPAQVAFSPAMVKGSVPKCGYRNVYGQSAKKEEKATKTNLYDPSNPKRFINSNIVGGNDTEIGEFPWQVSFRDPREKTNFCGGSIIDEYTILSAAHCFVETSSKGKLRFGGKKYEWTRTQFKVAVGWSKSMGAKKDVDDDDAKFGTSVYPIDLRTNKEKGKVIIHKDYHHGANSNGIANANDIAIVRLHKPIVFPEASDYGVPDSGQPAGAGNIQKGTFVRPVCFPSSNTPGPRLLTKWGLHDIPKARRNVNEEVPSYLIITGYGNTDAGTLHGTGQDLKTIMGSDKKSWKIASDRLLKANIYGMDNNKCQAKLKKSGKGIKISEKQVCAQHLAIGGEVVDTCQGDSGGPIVYAYQKCKLPGMTKAQINKCIEKSHGHNDKWDQHILYGVTSYGFGCGEHKTPGMYTRVTEYMDWITDNGARPQYADSLN